MRLLRQRIGILAFIMLLAACGGAEPAAPAQTAAPLISASPVTQATPAGISATRKSGLVYTRS